MTRGWRIVKAKHAPEAFTGEGARLYGGRWNQRGAAAVYLGDSLALAALEQFVHMGKASSGLKFIAFEVVIPDGVAIDSVESARLPRGWRGEPPPEETKDLGSAWIRGGTAVALRVPSAIVPNEGNYVLNPAHADFRRLHIRPAVPFSFDPRMWK